MAYEDGDHASTSAASNSISRGDSTDVNQLVGHDGGIQFIQVDERFVVECQNVPPSSAHQPPRTLVSNYVLCPSPCFDPIFDDLLEGGMSSGVGGGVGGGGGCSSFLDPVSEKTSSGGECTRRIEYLNELLRDEKKLKTVPEFDHLQRLVTNEIERVRDELRLRNSPVSGVEKNNNVSYDRGGDRRFVKSNNRKLSLLGPIGNVPASEGPVVTIVEKVYVPIVEFPDYNFIGRLVGPRGRTVKQIEVESGCQVMIRGQGSDYTRNIVRKRDQLADEQDNEPLHVRISITDHKERAHFMVKRVKDLLIEHLMVPVDDDLLKQQQLSELAEIRRGGGGRWRTESIRPSRQRLVPISSLVATESDSMNNNHNDEYPPISQAAQTPVQLISATSAPIANLVYVDPSSAFVLDPEANGYVPMLWPQRNA